MSDLEQFCLLAKTQKGLACSALVQQVTKKLYLGISNDLSHNLSGTRSQTNLHFRGTFEHELSSSSKKMNRLLSLVNFPRSFVVQSLTNVSTLWSSLRSAHLMTILVGD